MKRTASTRVDPYSLRLFITTAIEGSIVRGAHRENIAASALSRRIADLERAFETPLLVRSHKGISLTQAGTLVFNRGMQLEQDLEALAGEVRQLGGEVSGTVRLFANMSAVIGFLPERISSFVKAYPLVKVILAEADTRDVIRACLDDRADAGIAVTTDVPAGIETWDFASDPLIVVLPKGHTLTRQRAIKFLDILAYPLVRVRAGGALDLALYEHASVVGAQMNTSVTVTSFDACCRMVETGLGIAIIPLSASSAYAGSKHFIRRPLDEPWSARSLSVYALRKKPRLLAVQMLINALIAGSSGS